MVSAGNPTLDAEPVEAFIATIQSAGLGSEQDARSQVFAPTCCPEQIDVAPGIIMKRPLSSDYAPDLDIAQSKIRALRAQARSGKVAVINITMEPGMGKTIHLPFKFIDSNVLVVLPTVFDAWSAKLTAPNPAVMMSFGYKSDVSSNVTYTDSYYAAYLISTGRMTEYDMVFIDESHSADGVTTFLASVVVPGVSFVRMTATPKLVRTQPRRSFPIVDEIVAPSLSDVKAVATFVISRPEGRKLVMTPSPQSATLVSAGIPGSVLLTRKSAPADIVLAMNNQVEPVTIVTDSSCSKGINLNLDFVLDFGSVETPAGTRKITVAEQQQRRARVGRTRAGVYCCPFRAVDEHYEDHYSLFRSNLWCVVNDLQSFPCDIPPVTKQRALKLMRMVTEPATVPPESPLTSSSSSDQPDYVTSSGSPALELPHRPAVEVTLEDDVYGTSSASDDQVPSWVKYYLHRDNHPNTYTGDMVYDHRRLTKGLLLAPDFPVRRAENFVPKTDSVVDRFGPGRLYSSSSGNPVLHRRVSSSTKSGDTVADRYTSRLEKFADSEPQSGVPLKLKRGTRIVNGRLGTSYKALSVTGDHIVESGVLLAESAKVHPALRPLPTKLAALLSSSYADRELGRATCYLTWTVAKSLSSVRVDEQVSLFAALDAWSIPPVSEVPVINLQVDYHPSWSNVLAERIKCRQVLPGVVPAVGNPRRSIKCGDNVLVTALDACDDPSYSVSEQQLVYRAWNIVAAKTSFVAPCSEQVFSDATMLLAYMASADNLYRIS